MSFFLPGIGQIDGFQLLGLFGFFTYVTSYTCLSFRILSSESISYFALNTTAATLVMISLTRDFNLASALIQGFWIVLGVAAIGLRLHRAHKARRASRRALGQTHAPVVPLHEIHPRRPRLPLPAQRPEDELHRLAHPG